MIAVSEGNFSLRNFWYVLRFTIPLPLIPLVMAPLTYCPFTLPWIMCHLCPLPFCTFRYLRNYIIALMLGSALVLGRVFCGILCPYGAIQELLSTVGSKFVRVNLRLGIITSRVLSLILTVLSVITVASMINPRISLILNYPPTPIMDNIITIRLSLLIAFTILSLISFRLWCRICPLGFIIGIFNRLSILKLFLDKELCHKCYMCTRTCWLGRLGRLPLNSIDCIRCFKCICVCRYRALKLVPISIPIYRIGRGGGSVSEISSLKFSNLR